MNVFEKLNLIDVGKHIDKKGQLSYLSWAWAWATLKKEYPLSFYTVYENEAGYNYHHDNKTGWVKVGVTIEEMEIIEYLPIMDFRNKSITVNDITSMDVTKAIQRCATKAIGRHGLGLYIYAGEDLPEAPKLTPEELEKKKTEEEINNYHEEIKKIWSQRKKLGTHINEIVSSVKKDENLGVEKLTDCKDLEKLKAYYLKQQNKLTEQKKPKEEK